MPLLSTSAGLGERYMGGVTAEGGHEVATHPLDLLPTHYLDISPANTFITTHSLDLPPI